MKKLLPVAAMVVIGLMAFVTFATLYSIEANGEGTTVVDLLAGKTTDVGEVQVSNEGGYLYVKYVIDEDGWAITETHLHVATSVKCFPVAGRAGNPVPGKFDHKTDHDPAVTEYEYKIKLPKGDKLYIAAHAVVVEIVECEDCDCDDCFVDLDGFEDSLPETATVSLLYPSSDSPAYFPEVSVSDDTFLNGDHEGWCIDIGRTINQKTDYSSNVYSSYETIPTGLVDSPDNLFRVNWLLNQDFVGEESEEYDGEYFTYKEVQMAIWNLIDYDDAQDIYDDDQMAKDFSVLGFDRDLTAELVELAEDIEDYEPGCGERIGVIFAPVDSNGNAKQTVLIMVDLPCYCYGDDETAWGEGERFTKKGNWGMYFTYEVSDDSDDDDSDTSDSCSKRKRIRNRILKWKNSRSCGKK